MGEPRMARVDVSILVREKGAKVKKGKYLYIIASKDFPIRVFFQLLINGSRYVSCDYGTQNATVFLLWNKGVNGKWYCMGDYDRDNGYQRGSVTLEYETRKMTQDRGRLFQLDPMDINEANFIPTASAVMGEFQRTQVIPEIDAYRISKIATETITANKAGMIGYSYVPGTTGTSALRKVKEGIKAIRENYNGPLVCQATPDFIMELELELAGKIQYVEEQNNVYEASSSENGLQEDKAFVRYRIDIWDRKSTSTTTLAVDEAMKKTGLKRTECADILDPSGMKHKQIHPLKKKASVYGVNELKNDWLIRQVFTYISKA